MATRTKATREPAATGVLDAPSGDRDRVFEPFRHWGYLEADLDPLGFLPVVSTLICAWKVNSPTRPGAFTAAL